jgi:hypothetical protein
MMRLCPTYQVKYSMYTERNFLLTFVLIVLLIFVFPFCFTFHLFLFIPPTLLCFFTSFLWTAALSLLPFHFITRTHLILWSHFVSPFFLLLSVLSHRLFFRPHAVAGSSPDEVDFFNWPNPSIRTIALGSTQPLTEMSTRKIPGG